ncbi:MAG: DUF262 domain-containing protein [Dehalococcoidia bacterium]|nr:DUF262 domain-containing protein [Dehalococcoidia bacterium]
MGLLVPNHFPVQTLYTYWKQGILDLQPYYQRSRVWTDKMRYDLIDTALNGWPMGLIMLNVQTLPDADEVPVDHYEVVDGQQRIRTLLEYKDGTESWVKNPPKDIEFKPFTGLSKSTQQRFDNYEVQAAVMREFDADEILDIFSRLQHGKPLKIGEKIKALRTSFHPQIKELALHKIFDIASGAHKVRDAHWNLAAIFLKSVYSDDALARQEYDHLEKFLKGPYDEPKGQKALEGAKRTLNLERRVIEEAINLELAFEQEVRSARLLKWLFAALQLLSDHYNLSGKETSVARGLTAYYAAKNKDGSDESLAYLRTGRTGRIDTSEVKQCLEQLMNYIINSSKAEPLDPKRFFPAEQRSELFKLSKGKCQKCSTEISDTNFHADHIKPHTGGGKTDISNGQALCSRCNRDKGGKPELFNKPK